MLAAGQPDRDSWTASGEHRVELGRRAVQGVLECSAGLKGEEQGVAAPVLPEYSWALDLSLISSGTWVLECPEPQSLSPRF